MPTTNLEIKANLVLPTLQNLETEANLWDSYLKDLQSKGVLFRIYSGDLKSRADLVPVWWRDIKVKGNIEATFISPAAVVERIDFRAQFPKRPIARLKIETTVPANYEKVYASFRFNALIHLIVVEIPALGGTTVKIQLLDELGTVLYESGNQNEDQKVSLLLAADANYLGAIPIMGQPSIGLLLSAVQATAKAFKIMLYGR